MYEDSWYTFVPEAHGKQDDGHLQKSQRQRRESLLKQPSDVNHAATGPSDTLGNLLEELGALKGPPIATVARRAKSINDFSCVARTQIRKDTTNVKEYYDGEPMALGRSAERRLAFEKMYEAHEDELLHASQEEFHVYGDQLALSIRHTDGLLHDTSAALDLLASLSVSFKTVEGQTKAFQAQCEDVLAEQKRLKLLSGEVADGLRYYAYLEPITRRLNAPGASGVIGDEGFVEIMTNLDACIEFMTRNPEHKNSETYLTRYQSLLGRILTLIHNIFSKSIQDSATAAKSAEIERREVGGGTVTMTDVYIYQAPQSDAEVHHIRQSLHYISTNANKAIGMGFRESKLKSSPQPEWRAVRDHLSTYERQLNEMVDIYLSIRKQAILDYVDLLLSKTVPIAINPDIEFDRCANARECINMALEICGNEYMKYLMLFCGKITYTGVEEPKAIRLTIEKGKFRSFLHEIADNVSKFLVEQLRQTDMNSVVNMAVWLNERSYYQKSSDDVLSSHSDDEEDEVSQQHSSKVMAQVAGDINSMVIRLAFNRIRNTLFYNVEKYTIRSTDLAYLHAEIGDFSSPLPKPSSQLKHTKVLHEGLIEEHARSRLEKALGPGILDAYAPVMLACSLLLSVHDLSFEYSGENDSSGVAYEVIHEACAAIRRAAEQVKVEFSGIDCHLFSTKNLVLLKNLVLAYEIAGSRRASALDFKNIWTTFAELRNRGELFDIGSYYRLLASGSLFPKVVESVQDARVELDGLLRQNITLFCEESALYVWNSNLTTKSGTRTSSRAGEDHIKDRIFRSHPNEEHLRNTLWDAVLRVSEEKRRMALQSIEE